MTARKAMAGALTTGFVVAIAGAALAGFPKSPVTKCAPDAVLAGTVCMDEYEASVWLVPNPATTNRGLVRKIRKGTVTVDELGAAGATQLGTVGDNYGPCEDDGSNCADRIYAVSVAGVLPASSITWFQAQEACANSGKRLPTNAEWQIAANGSPDPGPDNDLTDCNSSGSAVVPTGSRTDCVSARGAFDMVGNLSEWVADWVPPSTNCPGWGSFSNDSMCLAGASVGDAAPAALLRGGDFFSGTNAGPLTVFGQFVVRQAEFLFGFRCAR